MGRGRNLKQRKEKKRSKQNMKRGRRAESWGKEGRREGRTSCRIRKFTFLCAFLSREHI